MSPSTGLLVNIQRIDTENVFQNEHFVDLLGVYYLMDEHNAGLPINFLLRAFLTTFKV